MFPGIHDLVASDRFAAAVDGTLTVPLAALAGTLVAGPLVGVAAAWARRRKSSARLGWGVAITAPYLAVERLPGARRDVLTAGLCAAVDRRGDAAPEGDRRRWLRLALTGAAGLRAKAEWRTPTRVIAIHSTPGEQVVAANEWTRRCALSSIHVPNAGRAGCTNSRGQ